MKKKEFKSSSKRVLDLMINSIYTNKEIFLRELLSNASDALDKLSYKALTDNSININKADLEINIIRDSDNRILTIKDNGIGMDASELENNLGTIAESGSFRFKEENKEQKDTEIIGQFGVGFLLLPRKILSMVDCFRSAKVANLFIVIFRLLHSWRMRSA